MKAQLPPDNPETAGKGSIPPEELGGRTQRADSRVQALVAGIVLVLLVLLVFSTAVRNGFINYDDDVYVTDNPHVQSGLNASSLHWAFKSFDAGNWHPITWISHLLDCQIFGLSPAGHHLTSILLHAANTLLLFLLLRSMTGATWRSFFVAGFFGLHPLHVESVAWVAERKDVLSACFGLMSIWAYAAYARNVSRNLARAAAGAGAGQTEPTPSTLHAVLRPMYLLSLAGFAIGLLGKPMLVTLPFLLLLLDIWPLGRWQPFGSGSFFNVQGSRFKVQGSQLTFLRLFLEKVPFILLAAAASVVAWLAQRKGGAVESLSHLPMPDRFENALVAYCRYLSKLFWPARLSVFYPYPGSWPGIAVASAALVLVGISVAAWALRRREPCILVGWLWFMGMLVPVIGLVQVGFQSLADRYTYVPITGLFIILVWGAHEWIGVRWPRLKIPLVGIGVALLGICAVLTRQQIGYWQDSGTLFQHALDVTRRNPIAELHLGSFQLRTPGKIDEAISHLDAAIQIEPRLPEPYDALGTALFLKGRRQEAISRFQQAIWLKPDYAIAHYNLGVVFQAEGRLDEALRQFEQALASRPDYAEACSGLGVVLAAQGQLDAGIAKFEQALRFDPSQPVVHFNLGLALLKQGRRQEAANHFSEALRLRPDYPEAQQQLRALNR